MGAWAALVSLVLGLITAISQSTSCARLIQICCAILKLGARSGCYAPERNEAAFSCSSGEPEGHGCLVRKSLRNSDISRHSETANWTRQFNISSKNNPSIQ